MIASGMQSIEPTVTNEEESRLVAELSQRADRPASVTLILAAAADRET